MALSPVSPFILLPSAGRTQSCSGPESKHCAKALGTPLGPHCPAPRSQAHWAVQHHAWLRMDTPRCPPNLSAVSPMKLHPKTALSIHVWSPPHTNLLPGLQVSPMSNPFPVLRHPHAQLTPIIALLYVTQI